MITSRTIRSLMHSFIRVAVMPSTRETLPQSYLQHPNSKSTQEAESVHTCCRITYPGLAQHGQAAWLLDRQIGPTRQHIRHPIPMRRLATCGNSGGARPLPLTFGNAHRTGATRRSRVPEQLGAQVAAASAASLPPGTSSVRCTCTLHLSTTSLAQQYSQKACGFARPRKAAAPAALSVRSADGTTAPSRDGRRCRKAPKSA
jgi:hypothetical protein